MKKYAEVAFTSKGVWIPVLSPNSKGIAQAIFKCFDVSFSLQHSEYLRLQVVFRNMQKQSIPSAESILSALEEYAFIRLDMQTYRKTSGGYEFRVKPYTGNDTVQAPVGVAPHRGIVFARSARVSIDFGPDEMLFGETRGNQTFVFWRSRGILPDDYNEFSFI